MNISPDEAEEALESIQRMSQKTRHSVASSGAYIFLVITGAVWLIGFLSTQFLPGTTAAYVWVGSSLLGSALSILIGSRRGRRLRSPSAGPTAKRAGIFWLLLALFAAAVIAVVQPVDGKQLSMLIILFIMIGQLAMGLLLSFSATWWAIPITVLALVGYFFLPAFFYLWMGLLVGGGMIAYGLYIRSRW